MSLGPADLPLLLGLARLSWSVASSPGSGLRALLPLAAVVLPTGSQACPASMEVAKGNCSLVLWLVHLQRPREAKLMACEGRNLHTGRVVEQRA